MGLLTSPTTEGNSKRFAIAIIKWEPRISPVLYLAGICWFLALAYYPYNAATYFSENALLPGLVTNEFSDGGDVHKTLQSLQAEMESSEHLPHVWLRARYLQMGLEVYGHNFTLKYPLGHQQVYQGENTYAILRAPRAGSTEAVVLAAPLRRLGGPHASNAAAQALMLSLAAYFRRQVYWAKDIIFLATEHEQLGAAAWLAAYHQVAPGHGVLHAGDLPARAGAIQAAINLEVESSSISHVDVAVEGLNGQLPNLDLVKMAHWLLHQEHIAHTTQNRHDHGRPSSANGYRHSLQTLLSMVVNQASGTATGNHGHFHQYGIQAVTLRAVEAPTASGSRAGLSHLGRALEGMFRSLNNLLERFHQSFFFYLMPATGRYISIGLYMPPFALMTVGVVLRLLTCWVKFCGSATGTPGEGVVAASATPDQQQPEKCREAEQDEAVEEQVESEEGGTEALPANTHASNEQEVDVTALLTTVLAAHAGGALLLAALAPATRLLAPWSPSTEQSVFYSLLTASALSVVAPLLCRRRLTDREQQLWRCVALAELALLLFTGALLNFSAALIVSFVFTPVALSARPYSSAGGRLGASVSLLLVHPFTLQLGAVALGAAAARWDDGGALGGRLLGAALAADRRAVTFALVDSLVYGARLLDVACTVLLPIWLQLWTLVHCCQA